MTDEQEMGEAIDRIFDHLNRRERKFTEVLTNKLISQHNTLQQCFFRAVTIAMKNYASNVYSDARNKASVEFSQKVKELDPTFPFI